MSRFAVCVVEQICRDAGSVGCLRLECAQRRAILIRTRLIGLSSHVWELTDLTDDEGSDVGHLTCL